MPEIATRSSGGHGKLWQQKRNVPNGQTAAIRGLRGTGTPGPPGSQPGVWPHTLGGVSAPRAVPQGGKGGKAAFQ